MRNAEEFPGRPSKDTRVMPSYWSAYPREGAPAPEAPGPSKRPRRAGRIRYASGALPRVEPLCRVFPGAYHPGTENAADAGDIGAANDAGHGGELGMAWSARYPVAGRSNDTWVLVCGGIAAVAAFAAAFVASGGVAGHAATPGTTVPAVTRACPSPAR